MRVKDYINHHAIQRQCWLSVARSKRLSGQSEGVAEAVANAKYHHGLLRLLLPDLSHFSKAYEDARNANPEIPHKNRPDEVKTRPVRVNEFYKV